MAQDFSSSVTGTGMHLYGSVLCEYAGTGTLQYVAEEHACRFVAGQLSDGSIILLCEFEDSGPELIIKAIDMDEPLRLAGETANGIQVNVTGSLRPINWLPDSSASAASAFGANELHVGFFGSQDASEIRFGLTNLKFLGTRPHKESGGEVWALPVAMQGLGVEGDASWFQLPITKPSRGASAQ